MNEWLSGDFETRSTTDLTKTGVYRYVEDAHTDVWCMAYAFDDEPVALWMMGQPIPSRVAEHIARGGKFRAWNCQFERTVWNYIMARRHGWPRLTVEQSWCTQAAALGMGLPAALDKTAEALGIIQRKDPEGRKLMLQMCKPRLVNVDGSVLWWDDNIRRQQLGLYCVRDVEVERNIGRKIRPITPSEREIYVLDQKINERGMGIDKDLVRAGLIMVNHAVSKLDADVKQLTNGMAKNARQRTGMLNWLWIHTDNTDVDSMDKHAVAELLRRDDLQGATRAVLSIRQETAKSSTAKLAVMIRAMNSDGRVRGLLQYMGARTTGRWAGRLLQPHNFPKGHIKPDDLEAIVTDVKEAGEAKNFDTIDVLHGPPLDVMASLLRGCIIASPGRRFIVVDFSAIEARILAWLAGERELLHLFGGGGDPYRAMAARVYGIARTEVNSDQRWLGKQLVLSCGYQCGWENLRNRLEKENIYVGEDEARDYIDTYRKSNPAIVALWGNVGDAAMTAIRNPGIVYSNGRLTFAVKHGFLWMKLPSNRVLAYMRPEIENVTTIRNGEPWTRDQISYVGVDPITYRWANIATWGSRLVENAVQGLARDVLAQAMLRAEAKGYTIILHVHDELVCESPDGFGSVAELEAIAAELPPWLTGCPIKAEGWAGPRYRK